MHRSARGWIARSPRWPALLALALVAGCAATAPSASAPRASSEASAAPSAVAGGGTVPLDPGGLEAGTRYVMADLGLSIRPDVDGWFAVLPQGGDVAFSMGDVTVYVLRPSTLLAPDGGSQIAVPADSQAFVAAIGATPIVEVTASEPFEASGLTSLTVDLIATGGSESNPLLTTGTGEYGLVDGEVRWIVLDVAGGPVVLSIERAQPDIEAAWEVAGPLIESLEAAP